MFLASDAALMDTEFPTSSTQSSDLELFELEGTNHQEPIAVTESNTPPYNYSPSLSPYTFPIEHQQTYASMRALEFSTDSTKKQRKV